MPDPVNCASLLYDCNPFANRCCEAFLNFVMERTVNHLAYVYNLEDNLRDLDSTFGQLTLLKDRVMDWVRQAEAAEQQDMQRTRKVEDWFQRVATWRAKGTELLNETERDRQCQRLCLGGSCSTDYCSTSAFGGKVAKCLEELTALLASGGKFTQDEVAEKSLWNLPKSGQSSETARYPLVVLEAKRDDVVTYLEEVHLVGVFGKPGVGKTTFLKLLKAYYDLLRVQDDLRVIWIEKLNDWNEETIQQAIKENIGLLNDWTCETVEDKASHISRELQRKRFILLLDGIMRSINLQNIGVPNRYGLNGSKVVFTTRNMDVCDNVEPTPEKTVSIEILEDSEARKLLLQAAGQDTTTNQIIKDHATTVAKMCGGLPHALIKVGEGLRRKTSPEEWIYVTNFFQNPARDSTTGAGLFSKLRCSYDDLPDDIHKACFLYCALFPAKREIPKAQLKELWIFGDFWIDSEDYESDGTRASRILWTLIDANLLEDRREGVKMHHVFRCMALWLATQDTLVVTGMQSDDPKAENLAGMKRVLLMGTGIDKLPKVPAYACRNLMTLFLTSNKDLRKISPGFFRFMAKLTVLNLSQSSLEELPRDISGLVSLKYLDISFTKITKLPSTLKKLVKLKYFNVNGLKLEFKMAKEVMSNLSCLKVLKMICSYSYDGEGAGQEDEVELLKLKNLENVNVLEIAVGSLPALTFLFSTRRLLIKTQRLRLRGFRDSECVDVSLSERTTKLVELSLIECKFQELSINLNRSATEEIYCNITRVAVVKCDSLLDLTCLVLLPYLQVLEVSNCLRLGDIISEEKFRRIEGENEIHNPFQNLTTLHLKSLRDLRRISSNKILFRSLNQLRVENCQNLTKLTLPPICRKDKIQLHAAQDWWDAIEWEAQDAKHAFSLHIIPTERRFVAR